MPIVMPIAYKVGSFVPEAVISQVLMGHSAKVNKLESDGRGPPAGQWTMQLAQSGHCWSASLLSGASVNVLGGNIVFGGRFAL
jgi:hypothetical protein